MTSKQADFVRNENIRICRQRLRTEADPQERARLTRLLAEELSQLYPPAVRGVSGERAEPAEWRPGAATGSRRGAA